MFLHPQSREAFTQWRRKALFLGLLGAWAGCSDLPPGPRPSSPDLTASHAEGQPSVLLVTPSGDPAVDAASIQAAIDGASPGDIVRLAAGVFYLGSNSTSDFAVTTATGSFQYVSQHQAWWLTGWPVPPHQSINIHKPVTVTGTTDANGERLTRIEYPNFQFLGPPYGWAGSTASFVINAPHVTIENLVISGLDEPVKAFHPGFDIRNNVFTNVAFGDYLLPDVNLTYPDWPQTNRAIVSRYRNNHLIFVAQPPHVVGSEIIVSGNRIEYIPATQLRRGRTGINVLPWSFGNERGAGFGNGVPFNHQINWDFVLNITIERNDIDCNGASPGISVANPPWGTKGVVSNIRVVANTVRDCFRGMFISDGQSTPGDDVVGIFVYDNTFRDGLGSTINSWSYVDPTGVRELKVGRNLFVEVGGAGSAPVVWIERGVDGADVTDNDYSASGCPPWGEGAGHAFWPLPAGCIFLDIGSSGNRVAEKDFPQRTRHCDQVLDLGDNTIFPPAECPRKSSVAMHRREETADIPAGGHEGWGVRGGLPSLERPKKQMP